MVLLTGLLAAVTEADTWSISAGALLETIAFNMTGVASITCERSLFAACPGCELVCLGSTQRLCTQRPNPPALHDLAGAGPQMRRKQPFSLCRDL